MNNKLEYNEGVEAYNEGMSLSCNPYAYDADKFDAWAEGFFDAQDNED